MKIKVVGIEPKKYEFDNDQGQHVSSVGRVLHYTYALQPEGSLGLGCYNCYLSNNKFGSIDFKIGQIYWADSNRGKLSNFELYDKT